MMAEKTPKMIEVEKVWHESLETLLPKMVTAHGLTGTSERLWVSKATLGYWLLKLNIKVKRIALAPGDTLTLRRHNVGDITEEDIS